MNFADRWWALGWASLLCALGPGGAARADTASGPVITGVRGPPDGTYNLNDHYGAYVAVNFSQPVMFTGSPSITVRLGSTTVEFTGAFTAFNGQELIFGTPPAAQGALTITGPINLNGGSVKDANGNDAVLSFSPVSFPGVIIDKVPPASPTVSGITPSPPTSAQSFAIYGTSEPLGSVLYQMDQGSYNSSPVDANGNWSATFGPMSAGAHTFGADAWDQAGNSAGGPTGMTTHFQFTVQTAVQSGLPAHLVNLSVLAYANNGTEALAAGFVVGGDTASTKTVLMRGIGPTLAQFGVPAPVAKAALRLYRSDGHLVATNDGWGTDPLLSSTAAQVSAFSLPANSGDSAIVWALYPGAYTIQVSDDTGAGGTALGEVYDAAANDLKTRLVNISARARIGTAVAGVLSGGFVISGSGSETVLIRGIGPALAQFSVPQAATAPQLSLYDHNNQILAQNAGWPATATVNGSSVSLADIFTKVGAFALTAGSADCAILVTLPAGVYTAQLGQASGSSGQIGLLEIYEVSSQ